MLKYLTGIIATLTGMLALAWSSRKTHKQRADQAEKQKDEVIEHVQKANEADRVVSNDPDPVKRLRDEWSRD